MYSLSTRPSRAMEEFINDVFGSTVSSVERFPLTNIGSDENKTLFVELAVAGFSKEDIKIDIKGNMLTIEGTNKLDEDSDGITWTQRHISSRDFKRVIKLHDNYIDGEVKASMENGILTIQIQSAEPQKNYIQIQ